MPFKNWVVSLTIFGTLSLGACNHAGQNSYSMESSNSGDPVQAERMRIEKLCNLKYYGTLGATPGNFGTGLAAAANAKADCLLKYQRPLDR